jgi:hypothetical protein
MLFCNFLNWRVKPAGHVTASFKSSTPSHLDGQESTGIHAVRYGTVTTVRYGMVWIFGSQEGVRREERKN